MLFQVGGQGSRPTFFEMAAAQQLPTNLRAALTYSIGVLSVRTPLLSKILDYEDEAFALLMLVLETHSLRMTDASFSESLYGLRRRSVDVAVAAIPQLKSSSKAPPRGMQKQQKIASLFFLVILPYLRSKLQALYNKEREAVLRASLWGHEDTETYSYNSFSSEGVHSGLSSGMQRNEISRLSRLKMKIQVFIGSHYPCIHAANEGLRFAYQLLYLLDVSGFYSPDLHMLKLHVCRSTGQELMDASSRISEKRRLEQERLHGPPWLKVVQRGLLNGVYTILDYEQTGLIAAVFVFKIMEWWYRAAEGRISSPTVYPTPPPPPPPKHAEGGISVPLDGRICPLCLQRRQNPSVTIVSGYVFCYSCIFTYVTKYNRCPVTLIPTNVAEVRRLFHDT